MGPRLSPPPTDLIPAPIIAASHPHTTPNPTPISLVSADLTLGPGCPHCHHSGTHIRRLKYPGLLRPRASPRAAKGVGHNPGGSPDGAALGQARHGGRGAACTARAYSTHAQHVRTPCVASQLLVLLVWSAHDNRVTRAHGICAHSRCRPACPCAPPPNRHVSSR
jgi:hypothetical protein